jgi:Amt family ammonium transporter
MLGNPVTYYLFHHTIDETAARNNAPTIPNNIFAFYELSYALMGPSIIASSLAGRLNLTGFLVFIGLWHIGVYCPVAHILWSANGAYYTNTIRDFAGGLVIHILSATTALVVHLILGKDAIPAVKPVSGKSPTAAASIGTVFVWLLWVGAISGKSLASNTLTSQCIVNALACSASSVILSYFVYTLLEKQITTITMINALLIGLVAISPAAGFVSVGGALCIGVSAYLVTFLVSFFLFHEGSLDILSMSVLTIV